MTKAASRHMIVLDFGHQTGLDAFPFSGPLRRPAAWTSWRFSREPFASHVLELACQCFSFVIGNARRETDVIKPPILVEQAEQQRPYEPLAGRITEATDNAVS